MQQGTGENLTQDLLHVILASLKGEVVVISKCYLLDDTIGMVCPKGLAINYGEMGGYKTGGGGGSQVLPLLKREGGAEELLAMLKGRGLHNKFQGSLNTGA